MNEESEYKDILLAMMTLSARYFKSKAEQVLKYALLGDLQKTMTVSREIFAQLRSYAGDIDEVARFISDTTWRAKYRKEFAQFICCADHKLAEILRIGMALQMSSKTYLDA